MTFDVVIGNPSYNNGADLDFVDLAYRISKDNTGLVCMITPAKWQTTSDDYIGCASENIDYTEFRNRYVEYMDYICYYPVCRDIFEILQADGITYYLLTKQKHERCVVENKCKHIKAFNSIETRDIRHRESLFNIGNEIVNYLGDYKRFTFQSSRQHEFKRYQVWTNTKIPGGGLSALTSPKKTYFVGESHIEENYGWALARPNSIKCIFSSDIESECESFISWLNCKFTRFFVAINVNKLTGILTDDYFRFVPAPPDYKFNHIYTDQELYNLYNIPQKYIEVIESIVKDRE